MITNMMFVCALEANLATPQVFNDCVGLMEWMCVVSWLIFVEYIITTINKMHV